MWILTLVTIQFFGCKRKLKLDISGASRYVSTGSGGANSGAEYADPFTGASRYRSQGGTTPSAPSAPSSGDPFTGASRYNPLQTNTTPQLVPPPPRAPTDLLPVVRSFSLFFTQTDDPWQTIALNFKQANVAAMQGKLFQFNDVLKSAPVSQFMKSIC